MFLEPCHWISSPFESEFRCWSIVSKVVNSSENWIPRALNGTANSLFPSSSFSIGITLRSTEKHMLLQNFTMAETECGHMFVCSAEYFSDFVECSTTLYAQNSVGLCFGLLNKTTRMAFQCNQMILLLAKFVISSHKILLFVEAIAVFFVESTRKYKNGSKTEYACKLMSALFSIWCTLHRMYIETWKIPRKNNVTFYFNRNVVEIFAMFCTKSVGKYFWFTNWTDIDAENKFRNFTSTLLLFCSYLL